MLNLLYKRRSIRKYKATPIEKEKVEKLIKAALLSPSSRNGQPWEFIVVEDKETLDKLSYAKPGAAALKNASLGIVVLADPRKSDVWVEDTSIASILIQLAAESMGLGSCWIQIRERRYSPEQTAEDYVRGILAIPENIKVESIISIGYPDETRPAHKDEDIKFEKVFRERYGAWYNYQ